MQAHLHVGRNTFKRNVRNHFILLSPFLFCAIFGFPFMRAEVSEKNGKDYVDYFFVATERYEIVDNKYPPLLILIPLWWPHKDASGLKWLRDTWDKQNWSDQK